jgi:hypothetical protein
LEYIFGKRYRSTKGRLLLINQDNKVKVKKISKKNILNKRRIKIEYIFGKRYEKNGKFFSYQDKRNNHSLSKIRILKKRLLKIEYLLGKRILKYGKFIEIEQNVLKLNNEQKSLLKRMCEVGTTIIEVTNVWMHLISDNCKSGNNEIKFDKKRMVNDIKQLYKWSLDGEFSYEVDNRGYLFLI